MNSAWFHFYVQPETIKLIESESEIVIAKGWGGWKCVSQGT